MMVWRFGRFEWRFPGLRVMGILNVTPDSFFDGGRHAAPGPALERARRMIAEGADLIDVGGESTRPGAAPVSEEEELARVIPVIRLLAAQIPAPISVDTTKAAVARQAVAAGASIINDISAGRHDPAVLQVASETGAGLILMHSRGDPRTMQTLTQYQDICADVARELAQSLDSACAAGVSLDRIAVDPGFGFAKTGAQNVELLRGVGKFRSLDRPVVVGVSRKSFLGTLVDRPAEGRLAASIAAQLHAAQEGCQVIRTHDVRETVETLKMLKAILATEPTGVRR